MMLQPINIAQSATCAYKVKFGNQTKCTIHYIMTFKNSNGHFKIKKKIKWIDYGISLLN